MAVTKKCCKLGFVAAKKVLVISRLLENNGKLGCTLFYVTLTTMYVHLNESFGTNVLM